MRIEVSCYHPREGRLVLYKHHINELTHTPKTKAAVFSEAMAVLEHTVFDPRYIKCVDFMLMVQP